MFCLNSKVRFDKNTLNTKVSYYHDRYRTRLNWPMICLQHNPLWAVSLLKYLHEQKTEIVTREKGACCSDAPQRMLWSYINADRNSPTILFAILSTLVDIKAEVLTRKIFALWYTLSVHNCRTIPMVKFSMCSILSGRNAVDINDVRLRGLGLFSILAYLNINLLLKIAIFNQIWVCKFKFVYAYLCIPRIPVCVIE